MFVVLGLVPLFIVIAVVWPIVAILTNGITHPLARYLRPHRRVSASLTKRSQLPGSGGMARCTS